MSKELDVRVTEPELASQIGALVLEVWKLRKQVAVLEACIDELDPDGEAPADA